MFLFVESFVEFIHLLEDLLVVELFQLNFAEETVYVVNHARSIGSPGGQLKREIKSAPGQNWEFDHNLLSLEEIKSGTGGIRTPNQAI